MSIPALIEQLAHLPTPYVAHQWRGWQIRPIISGNNLLFRATRDGADLAIKLLIRDERNRAQREFSALTLLESLGSPVAPRPIFLDLDSYRHAVLAQTWVDGHMLQSAPDDDSTWLHILQTYHAVHRIGLDDIMRQGVAFDQTVSSTLPDQAVSDIIAFARQVPPEYYAESLAGLIDALVRMRIPTIHISSCLCHGDPNVRNMIVTSSGARLVDWEYSCVNDPAHEIAALMSHPVGGSASEDRSQWIAEQYALLSGEPNMLPRIRLHYALRLAWWCVRLLFGRYVLLQRPSHRLVGPGAEEEISTLENIDRYFSRAHMQLARFM
jgi:aminoglycoside phosphotransferase (APT) family kinase protein